MGDRSGGGVPWGDNLGGGGRTPGARDHLWHVGRVYVGQRLCRCRNSTKKPNLSGGGALPAAAVGCRRPCQGPKSGSGEKT